MNKKFLVSLIAVALSLLSFFVYQWATNGTPPDVEKFLKSATCEASNGTVTVTASTGEKIVVSFPSLQPTAETPDPSPDNILYYDVGKQGERAIPISLLNYAEKYKGVINLARDCLLKLNPAEAATDK